MEEIDIYNYIYNCRDKYVRYGESNHGFNAYNLLKSEIASAKTILDVGCGYNNFLAGARKMGNRQIWQQIGVDFACPGADIKCDILNLPFHDKIFDLLTAFDVLEHISTDNIDIALAELQRVSNNFIFSISYIPANTKVPGVDNIHLTVQDKEWWLNKIGQYCENINIRGEYIYGTWLSTPNNITARDINIKIAQSLIVNGAPDTEKYNNAVCWLLYQSIRDKKNYFIKIPHTINYSSIFNIKSPRWKLSIICAAIFYLIIVENNFEKAHKICSLAVEYILISHDSINEYTFCNVAKIYVFNFLLKIKLNTCIGNRDELISNLKTLANTLSKNFYTTPARWDVLFVWGILLCIIHEGSLGKGFGGIVFAKSSRFYPTVESLRLILE